MQYPNTYTEYTVCFVNIFPKTCQWSASSRPTHCCDNWPAALSSSALCLLIFFCPFLSLRFHFQFSVFIFLSFSFLEAAQMKLKLTCCDAAALSRFLCLLGISTESHLVTSSGAVAAHRIVSYRIDWSIERKTNLLSGRQTLSVLSFLQRACNKLSACSVCCRRDSSWFRPEFIIIYFLVFVGVREQSRWHQKLTNGFRLSDSLVFQLSLRGSTPDLFTPVTIPIFMLKFGFCRNWLW